MKEIIEMTVAEAIPSNQIFAHMSGLSFIPSPLVAEYLDLEYFYNHSQNKAASPLVLGLNVQTWEAGAMETKLASIITNRYKAKWEQLFSRFSDMSTINLLDNINLERETEYGKEVTTDGIDDLTKSGSETHTLGGSETRTESFPSDRKTTREISGGWKDTDTTATTRTGLQDVTESYSSQTPRISTKTTLGGYTDTDTTANTRTGQQTVTDKGNTLTGTFGFNSSTAVGASLTGPETSAGVTQETTYGQEGLKDTHSGAITRSYGENGLTETTTETGSKTLSTSYGQEGLKDANSGNIQRLYENYKDEVKETGTKQLEIAYGVGGKTDELSFDNRIDSREYGSTVTNSGTDTTTEKGYMYRRDTLVSQYLALFTSAEYFDFLSIVYNDCDEVLAGPYYI